MKTDFHVIIPARYQSTRLPGKLLEELDGMSVLERVYRQALLAAPQSITIATDSELILEHARQFTSSVVMTKATHETGTDRIAEVLAKGDYHPNDIIVNVQGDEPFIAPELIIQVANSLNHTQAPMATLCWPIESLEMFNNPNVVKVVRTKDEHALYFSRSPIPAHRDDISDYAHTYRHIGLYAYRVAFLLDYIKQPPCPLETIEALEQLRVLWSGVAIKVEEACVKPLQDINTYDDLLKARALLLSDN